MISKLILLTVAHAILQGFTFLFAYLQYNKLYEKS